MSDQSNGGPGYRKHPEHRVSVAPAGVRVQVIFNHEVIADSKEALRLEETRYDPVYYVPRQHVKMERLVRTTDRTYCPFKGEASYYTLSNGRIAADAAWSYEAPYDEVVMIKEYLAFYPDRVDSIVTLPNGD